MLEKKESDKGKRLNQRMQHFLVLQYLLEHSDENHYVKVKDLLAYLKDCCDVCVECRSIYKDVREINIAKIMLEEGIDHQEAEALLEEDPDRATIKFKKKNGYKRSTELSAEYGLYRQDYCGCVFSKEEQVKRRAAQAESNFAG